MWQAASTLAIVVLHAGAIFSVLVRERRQPSATLAWLLTLIFLPAVGLVLYALFGTTNAKRVAARYREAVAHVRRMLDRYGISGKLEAAGEGAHDERTRSLLALGSRLSSTPPSRGNRAQLLVDAGAAYPAMMRAIEEARHHVHLEFYIVQPDEIGRRLRDALERKAREGVEVRVVCDGLGSLHLPGDFWRPLVAAGGEAAVFRPVGRTLARLHHRDRADFRNHRKLLVVDGIAGFTGGINVGREYLGLDPTMGHWRDTHVGIHGPAVLSLQAAFAEDWVTATGRLLDDARYFPDPAGRDDGPYVIQVIDSGPDRSYSPIAHVFVHAYALARERIWVTSPYFVPTPAVEHALIGAALRGVDVRLLLPLRPDHPIAMAAASSYFPPLLEAGVRIFRYRRGFMHAKTLVVDDWVSAVGSANLDMRSFHLNFELNAFVFGSEFAGAMAAQFERDLGQAQETGLEHEQGLGVTARVLRAGARLLSPLL